MRRVLRSHWLSLLFASIALAYAVYHKLTIQQRIDREVEIAMLIRESELEKSLRGEIPSDTEIAKIADEVLRKRESKFVKFYFPYFMKTFYEGKMIEPDENYTLEKVNTFEDLCRPMMQILKNLSG